MKPILINKVQGKRVMYIFQCAECSSHYYGYQYGEKISEYCPECRRKHSNLKQRQKIVRETLEEIKKEIIEYKDDNVIHTERNEMIDIVISIIEKHKKGVER